MEQINLPIEKACEPSEEARQPRTETMYPPLKRASSKFANEIEDVEIDKSQKSQNSLSQKSSYKEKLSQPPPGIPHYQKLLWLQKRHKLGLWAQCDDCDAWRYLPHILDRHELPKKWFCHMNPDKTIASCAVPEVVISLREEEDLVHAEYSAGSVVWARLPGYPWWPAMVDDCVDVGHFYWLDGFSDIPTHYNVVFFDSMEVTRAWIAPEQLKPYATSKKQLKPFKGKKYNNRLQAASKQADDAMKLNLSERLEKYSFLSRYKGTIHPPKHISQNELKKIQRSLKRKYNIDFPIEVFSDEEIDETSKNKSPKKNVILLGTPKTKAARKSMIDKNGYTEFAKPNHENETESENTLPNLSKQPNSMAVQVGSTVNTSTFSVDQDTSKTYVPSTEAGITESTENCTDETDSLIKDINVRIASPRSDDFDF